MTPAEPTPRYRILYVQDSDAWGGLEMNVIRLAGWLTDRGHEVVLCTVPDSPSWQAAQARGLPVEAYAPRRRFGDWQALRQLTGYIRRHRPQVVLEARSKNLNASVLARNFSGVPAAVVYQQHMQFARSKRDWVHTWIYRQLAAWIAPLPGIRAQVLAHTRMRPERVHVIPLTIDPAPFLAAPSRAEARAALAVPADAFLVGIIGRIDPEKGQLLLLDALRRLRDQGLPVQVLFVGAPTVDASRGIFRQQLDQRLHELGLQDAVHLRPFMTNPAAAYAALDVFVMGTANETYGMTILESMAAGTPVLAARRGGPTEMLQEGQTGLFFTSQDAESLAQAIADCYRNPGQLAPLAEQARADLLARWTVPVQVAAYEALFAQVVRSH